MRYLMMVILPAGNDYEKGAFPTPELVAEMTKYNEEMAKSGVLLSLDGLHPTSKGARIETRDGERFVTDGPFAESREVIGGYWTIEVKSKEEALDWAKRVPDHDAIIELRQIFDMEDFPQDVQDAADSSVVRERLDEVSS